MGILYINGAMMRRFDLGCDERRFGALRGGRVAARLQHRRDAAAKIGQVATILAGHDERTLVKSVVKWPEHRAIYP